MPAARVRHLRSTYILRNNLLAIVPVGEIWTKTRNTPCYCPCRGNLDQNQKYPLLLSLPGKFGPKPEILFVIVPSPTRGGISEYNYGLIASAASGDSRMETTTMLIQITGH